MIYFYRGRGDLIGVGGGGRVALWWLVVGGGGGGGVEYLNVYFILASSLFVRLVSAYDFTVLFA